MFTQTHTRVCTLCMHICEQDMEKVESKILAKFDALFTTPSYIFVVFLKFTEPLLINRIWKMDSS